MTYKYYIMVIIVLIIFLNSNSRAKEFDFSYKSDNQFFTSDRYVTDKESNIRLLINIWGQGKRPSHYLE